MKKMLVLLLAVLLVSPMVLSAAAQTELVVFAAASLTEALTEISAQYEAENPDVSLVFSFDSSGTLKTQIEEGADCDVFISAAQKQMNELSRVDPETRIDLLENKVALVVPEGNPAGIDSFEALSASLRDGELLMAMGNADVPVGQYTQKILDYYGLAEADLAAAGRLSYGSNVKEVVAQVAEGSVDCGVVYATDAASASLTVVDTATPEMCGQVIYPAAALTGSANPEAARAFLEYLRGDQAAAVFERIGFSPVE